MDCHVHILFSKMVLNLLFSMKISRFKPLNTKLK